MRATVQAVQDLSDGTFCARPSPLTYPSIPGRASWALGADDECAQKALRERGIDQMLEEAKADNRENDAEFMKPSGKL